jgi:glycosyltransferase involved in cell wall biosynthesis
MAHADTKPGLVSIIIPCFNYGHFLTDALSSVRVQSFENWECLIVDDGSTDDTATVAKKFVAKDSRYLLIRQNNQGLAAARNTGIRAAKGEYIQLLDADDRLESDKLRVQANLLQVNDSVDLVYGEAAFFLSEKPEILYLSSGDSDEDWMARVTGHGSILLSHLVTNNIMVVNAPLFRQRLVANCGHFNEALSAHEDWEFWLRCALNGATFQYLEANGTRALVRSHSESMSTDRLHMCVTNLAIRNTLATSLPSLSLRILNCDRAFQYAVEADGLSRESNLWKKLRSVVRQLLAIHGPLPFCGALVKRMLGAGKNLLTATNTPGNSGR